MTDEVGVQVARMTFRVDWPEFDKTAQKYRDNTSSASVEYAETIIRLVRLYLEEFIDGHNYSLSVWGWLKRLASQLGDDHDLEYYFRPTAHRVLELKIFNPENYLLLFAGVKVGYGIKDPSVDPVEHRALPPDMRDKDDEVFDASTEPHDGG